VPAVTFVNTFDACAAAAVQAVAVGRCSHPLPVTVIVVLPPLQSTGAAEAVAVSSVGSVTVTTAVTEQPLISVVVMV
jgi:hypothetical protein